MIIPIIGDSKLHALHVLGFWNTTLAALADNLLEAGVKYGQQNVYVSSLDDVITPVHMAILF